MTTFILNGQRVSPDLPDDTPLLWALRDGLDLTGTKFGCGMGLCGACTVHLDGEPVRACSTPLSAVAGKKVTTIEGVDAARAGQAVQAAWQKLDVVQCGYCQSGQIMSATALLVANPRPTDA
ncbi:MAG: (2Fe-2S)-binding protein, partial [Azoarcus sp.]|nr:(2Fe-2S)-binding protein [Azoarcus sp.]